MKTILLWYASCGLHEKFMPWDIEKISDVFILQQFGVAHFIAIPRRKILNVLQIWKILRPNRILIFCLLNSKNLFTEKWVSESIFDISNAKVFLVFLLIFVFFSSSNKAILWGSVRHLKVILYFQIVSWSCIGALQPSFVYSQINIIDHFL